MMSFTKDAQCWYNFLLKEQGDLMTTQLWNDGFHANCFSIVCNLQVSEESEKKTFKLRKQTTVGNWICRTICIFVLPDVFSLYIFLKSPLIFVQTLGTYRKTSTHPSRPPCLMVRPLPLDLTPKQRRKIRRRSFCSAMRFRKCMFAPGKLP